MAMTIEIEPDVFVDVQPDREPDDADVSGALFDILARPIWDGEGPEEIIEPMTTAHQGEDELSLWFG
jgi:hypothetical protein